MIVLAATCFGLAFYFCSLQTTYYQHYQPFFDSLSYYNEIHRVMTTGQNDGVAAALDHAVSSRSTVFLPKMIAALASSVFAPSRNFSVWLQTTQLFVLMGSLLYYYRRVHQTSPWHSLFLVMPLFLVSFMYERHGGVSDFRMDLSLYFTYTAACVWYLIATHTLQMKHFLILGVVIAAACLFRATAPVYLALALGPPALFQLWKSQQRRQLFKGFATVVVTVLAGSLWFFVINFELLHHYYFVWNTDANAKLPLSQSWMHIKFAVRHLGAAFWYWCLLMNGLLLWVVVSSNQGEKTLVAKVGRYFKESLASTNLILLWFAAAPLAMLVLRGAGLNPYVCLPAVGGIYLFLLDPIAKLKLLNQHRSGRTISVCLLAIGLAIILNDGFRHHQKGNNYSMAAHKKIISTMLTDANEQGLASATFDSSHVYYMHTWSLASSLRFDIPQATFEDNKILVDGLVVRPRAVFSRCVATADWNVIKGSTAEKLDSLVSRASQELDYLLMPVGESVEFMQSEVTQNVINRHQRYICDAIKADADWEPVGSPVKNRAHEMVQLYRNTQRIEIARNRRSLLQKRARQAKRKTNLH